MAARVRPVAIRRCLGDKGYGGRGGEMALPEWLASSQRYPKHFRWQRSERKAAVNGSIRFLPILAILLLVAVPAVAEPLAPRVCFTPGGKCTDLVVSEIAVARHSILVQAYSFTSVPILSALKEPHAHRVDVEVIVDKNSARQSKSGSRYSAATYLTNAGIPVWVDTKVAIAHNKVMVIDGQRVITGSFNFTAAAQNHNAENLLVLDDPALATQYRANWERRRSVSMPYTGALPPAPASEEEE
jgi:phosphatidylserine/phosphatidylglycerophosphate/cardiolipin synthase-like enzyme